MPFKKFAAFQALLLPGILRAQCINGRCEDEISLLQKDHAVRFGKERSEDGQLPGGMQAGMPRGMPGVPGSMMGGMLSGMQGGMPEGMPRGMPGGATGAIPSSMPMPGAMQGGMPGSMPLGMPGGMQGGMPPPMLSSMPGGMPGTMPWAMPGAMPSMPQMGGMAQMGGMPQMGGHMMPSPGVPHASLLSIPAAPQQNPAGHGRSPLKAAAAPPSQLATRSATATASAAATKEAGLPVAKVQATGIIPGVAGYTSDRLNPNPAEMPFPGPIMAPPPMSFAEVAADDDDIGKAKADQHWAKTQQTANYMFYAQADMAQATASRDRAWASQEELDAQSAYLDAEKKHADPLVLAASKERLELAKKDKVWAMMEIAAADWQYGMAMKRAAEADKDEDWADAELRAAKRQEGHKIAFQRAKQNIDNDV